MRDSTEEESPRYHVQFPNRSEEILPGSQLYVRWLRAVDEPTDYLAARLNETPYWHDGRTQFVRAMTEQRAIFRGLPGLASASIDLHAHQFAVVQRVIRDPVQRYLLADEVGLGKTIEAAVIVRQFLLQRGSAESVLIVVPPHLQEQWGDELRNKFHLDPFLGRTVHLVSSEDLEAISRHGAGAGMLVVDEAHQLAMLAHAAEARQRTRYEVLRLVALQVPRLLLLSATPALTNEDGFLAMLHLLDPAVYPLDNRDGFRHRVQSRQHIAEQLGALQDDIDGLFLEQALDELARLVPDDTRLRLLSDALRPLIDQESEERAQAIRVLRVHLSETYRIHRRLLRTRRDGGNVARELPERRGLEVLEHPDRARLRASDFLEAWRLQACVSDQASSLGALFTFMVEASLSHPAVLCAVILARLRRTPPADRMFSYLDTQAQTLPTLPSTFPGESALLEEYLPSLTESIGADPRIISLINVIEREATNATKCVVFVDLPPVADDVFLALQRTLGERVARLEPGSGATKEFLDDPGCLALVCDRRTEEGLNLQGTRAVIVHYDLPLAPNRIEQRQGRLDRLGGQTVVRAISFASGGSYDRAWLNCLRSVVRVFHRSVAPLQYALEDVMAQLRNALLEHGIEAITDACARMQAPDRGLDRELRRIGAQEALDSIDLLEEGEQDVFENLTNHDLEDDPLRQAVEGWVLARLAFKRFHVPGEPASLRYLFQGPEQRPSTLLSAFDFVKRMASAVDRQTSAKWNTPQTYPVTYSRHHSWKRHRQILRIGHPFIDGLLEHTARDDRGIAFALWRRVPEYQPADVADLFFRFDFVVEADYESARRSLGGDASVMLGALQQRADAAFAPIFRTVWIDADLQEITAPAQLRWLTPGYSKDRDHNLNLQRWPAVADLGLLANWELTCRAARSAAEERLRASLDLRTLCEEHARRLERLGSDFALQFASRIARLDGSARQAEEEALAIERRITAGLATGIRAPVIRPDSVGAIFLSNMSPFDQKDEK